MSFKFPDSSPAPSTPDRGRKSSGFNFSTTNPSTTPAGPPPPSSAPSFTPAGDPSPSYLQSSMGAMSGTIKAPNFGRPSLTSSAKQSPSRSSNGPLGRSIRGANTRGPSRLNKSFTVEDEEEDEDEDDGDIQPSRPGTYGMQYDDSDEDEEDAEGEDDDAPGEEDEYDEDNEEGDEPMVEEDDGQYDLEEDLLREMENETYGDLGAMDDMDLLMLGTPAADARVRKEADDIFRASSMRSLYGQKRDFKFASVAKDLYTQYDLAIISEQPDVILKTEDVVNRLYNDGVGPEDDEERLDTTLAKASDMLVSGIWEPFAEDLPRANEEHEAKVGPGPRAPDFEKATYVANLALQIHHPPRAEDEFGASRSIPLPAVLFRWEQDYHDLDSAQLESIQRHKAGPASHGLFWQGVFNALVRGNVPGAITLLRKAGFEKVKKSSRNELAYTGQTLVNINRVIDDLCQVMENGPCNSDEEWDTRSSDWTLFRHKANAAKDALISFAEGKDRASRLSGRQSDSEARLTGLARRAESRIPWEIYENIQSVYSILVGEADAILAAAADWCEATIGLFAWWDDGHNKTKFAHSQLSGYSVSNDDNLDRLALSFQAAMESDFHFNSLDPVEVAIACVFESNIEGLIGFLRTWSLSVASTVGEIASLGRWLPPPEPQNLIGMDNFDMEDLEVLGMNQSTAQEEKDGIKDTTLVYYARALRDENFSGESLQGKVTREGWEMAVQVVGRMDSPERSEEMVKELLQDVLAKIDASSQPTVLKVWRLLNDLGMINFAEDTAETFGDILARDTHRFGETLWYYALAHRPGKVRDVLNTLMSISLVESTVYPPEAELDDVLRRLLKERATALEQFAKQDLEAAELLGKMLSGYATLRRFYELREGHGNGHAVSLGQRQQAASALVAVVASADDNIRGGLYDDTRDAVVSEDFLLALLGEASVFVNQAPTVITLDQIDILLKAIEDIQTVGSRVYDASDEFFKLVLASGHGLKGSNPSDMLKKSTSSLGGSFMLTGSSMMASQLHQSVMKSGLIKGPIRRAWDWRTGVLSTSSSGDILKKIRLGLTKDLAGLWLEQADSVIL